MAEKQSLLQATRDSSAARARLGPAFEAALPVLVFLAPFPLAWVIGQIHHAFPTRLETALVAIGAVLALALALPAALYLLWQRRSARPATLGVLVVISMAVLLLAVYWYWSASHILFPADILIWSESDFVNDMLKFSVGYPLYSPQQNNDSFTYVPGPQLLTYGLAWLLGSATSIPVFRLIQVGYTLLACLVAVACCQLLVKTVTPADERPAHLVWRVAWLPILFLLATNSLTNPFTHQLHGDALALLLTTIAYWVLLKYSATRQTWLLALMVLLPAVGFLVRQSLIIWALFFPAYLLLFDRPWSWRRLVLVTTAGWAAVGLVIGACYLIWGQPFVYWVFIVLGRHAVSPLRSLQHVLDIWPYLGLGLFGGLVLVRGRHFQVLLGPWLIWLALILSEAYSSGIAWMLNHIGPASLLAGVWFLAGLARVWPLALSRHHGQPALQPWLTAGMAVALIGLLFGGLYVVRVPLPALPPDAYRYVGEIEQEMQGQAPETVLLDMGTWLYLPAGVVMKDRAPSIGERGYSESGDFSDLLSRLNQKRYTKILVRNLHSRDFWYDHASWRTSSGIKRTLLANYRETRQIAAVSSPWPGWVVPYGLSAISILEPRPAPGLPAP